MWKCTLSLKVNVITKLYKNTSHKRGRPSISKGGLFVWYEEILKLLDGVSNLNRDGNFQFAGADGG